MTPDPITAALERLFSLLDWWPDERPSASAMHQDVETGAMRWQRVLERELGRVNSAFLDEAVSRCTLEPMMDLPCTPATIITYYNWVQDDYSRPGSTDTYAGMYSYCTSRCAEIGFGDEKRQARVEWLKSQIGKYEGQQRRAIKLFLWKEINLRTQLAGNAS